MSSDHTTKPDAKSRAAEEIRELLVNATYLALFLCAFSLYGALITGGLKDKTVYFHLGTNIITALVIAKTIMVGDLIHLGGRSTHRTRALSVRTLYLTLVYGVFVLAVGVVEKIILGFFHRTDVRQTMHAWTELGWQEITARTIVIVLALLPYFALRELAAAAGRDKIYTLFFRRPAAPGGATPTKRVA